MSCFWTRIAWSPSIRTPSMRWVAGRRADFRIWGFHSLRWSLRKTTSAKVHRAVTTDCGRSIADDLGPWSSWCTILSTLDCVNYERKRAKLLFRSKLFVYIIYIQLYNTASVANSFESTAGGHANQKINIHRAVDQNRPPIC